MDFESLLHVAKKNAQNKKEPAKFLTTKFKPPTKEQREKDKVLSEGVQRFLARKEEEERRKREEAERQKEELLALRAKDPKAQKRIQTMLKRTKSANKSVMEDAIDNNNTADTLAGPAQPDEDDYGFVSESASALYNKLMQKMYSTPSNDVPKFAPSKKPNSSNLSNTKERVKAALLKEVEDEKLPHRRSRKSKTGEGDHNEDSSELNYSAPDRDVHSSSSSNDKDKQEKPKPKRPPPPPLDFHELLRIAEQKHREPVVIEPKVKKPPEPEVLMTKKQKLEYEKMLEWKKKRELRLQELENGDKTSDDKKIGKIPKIGQSSSESKSVSSTSQKIPKVNRDEPKVNGVKSIPKSSDKTSEKGYSNKGKDLDKSKSKLVPERKSIDSDKYKNISEETMRLKKERDEALRLIKEKEKLIKEKEEAERILKEKERLIRERDEAFRKLKEKEQLLKERDEAVRKLKMLEKSEKVNKTPVKNGSKPSSDKSSGLNYKNSVESIKSNPSKSDVKPGSAKPIVQKNGAKPGVREFPPKDVVRSREFPPKDVVRSREFPPKDVKSREFPPKDVQRKQFPPGDVRRKPQPLKRRRIDSDDEEYDSELEDFIDDGDPDVQQEEVSKVISEIFKYDKNKYARYADDDDECMESNFAQISKEEFISTKCGILEDLRDIQREKAMLARKKKR